MDFLIVSILSLLEIVMGNPGIFQGYLYPYPSQPIPLEQGTGIMWVWVRGLMGLLGTETCVGLEYEYTERPTHW